MYTISYGVIIIFMFEHMINILFNKHKTRLFSSIILFYLLFFSFSFFFFFAFARIYSINFLKKICEKMR